MKVFWRYNMTPNNWRDGDTPFMVEVCRVTGKGEYGIEVIAEIPYEELSIAKVMIELANNEES